MAFCSKCGTQMGDGVKFCPSCGTPAGGAAPAPQPRTVTVGQVKKCPNCGAEIESFQTRCPSCNYELQNKEISAAVRDFTAQVKKLDSESPAIKRGSRWPMLYAIGFAVFMIIGIGRLFPFEVDFLNTAANFGFAICMFMVPISILFGKPRMTAQEKQKKALVENFVVPNTREDLLEFFAFAVSQLEDTDVISAGSLKIGALVSSEKKYRLLWDKVWKTKCRQTYVKAKMAMADDQKTFNSITDMLQRAKAL